MTDANPPKVQLRRKSTMGQAVEKPQDTRGTLRRLLDYFARAKRLFVALLAAVLAVTVTSLLTPALQGAVIDAIQARTWDRFGLLLGCLLAAFAGNIAIMFWYCWQLTLITLVTVALTVLVTKGMSRRMRTAYRQRADALGRLDGHAQEMISGYRTILAYNRQDAVRAEFAETSDTLTREGLRAEVLGGSLP